MLSIIAAMTRNRVIGHQGSMPWNLPRELNYFKTITQNATVIMGRKTYDSIDYPLPHKRNIVLSATTHINRPHCEHYTSLDSALAHTTPDEDIFIIGGEKLYEQCLPLANKLYITIIDTELEGDTFFPQWNNKDWELLSQQHSAIDINHAYAYTAYVYKKINT